eukprot:g7786.t1
MGFSWMCLWQRTANSQLQVGEGSSQHAGKGGKIGVSTSQQGQLGNWGCQRPIGAIDASFGALGVVSPLLIAGGPRGRAR